MSTISATIAQACKSRLGFIWQASRKEWLAAGIAGGVVLLMSVAAQHAIGLHIDASEGRCMPERFYVSVPLLSEPQRGDVVSFSADGRIFLGLMDGKRIGKIIVGIPGDRVTSNQEGLYVNGALVAVRNQTSMANIKKAGKVAVDLDKTLQVGELIAIGSMPRSFDSRYWGVLPSELVDRKLIPVL